LKVPKANRLPMSRLMGGQSTFNVHLRDFSLRRQAPDVSGKREFDNCFLRQATSNDVADTLIHFTSLGSIYSCHIRFPSCSFRVILIHTFIYSSPRYMFRRSAVWQAVSERSDRYSLVGKRTTNEIYRNSNICYIDVINISVHELCK
jgi:hypothetical protein